MSKSFFILILPLQFILKVCPYLF